MLAILQKGGPRLYTRSGNDWTRKFGPLHEALIQLGLTEAILDGEVVHASADGVFSFHALQDALATGHLTDLRYYVFDLLHLNGTDLRSRPLTERKALLQGVLVDAPPMIAYSDHFEIPGDEMLARACDLALEGILSKRADAPYRSGRTLSWLKSKCIKEQEFVIGGYTEQPEHPGVLGALLVGYYEDGTLRFAGKVGTGFNSTEARSLLKMLRSRAIAQSAFTSVPSDARRGARFVQPELVAHVKFAEWTPDGRLRHPSFQGVREDKAPTEITREKEKSLQTVTRAARKPVWSPRVRKAAVADDVIEGVTITHPERLLWPAEKITKLDLAHYYAAIAPRLLAQAGSRPTSLLRCPQGPGKPCFFQRHAGGGTPTSVRGITVAGHGEGKPYLYIEDAHGLLSLVQMGAIELHVWNARISDVKHPDRVVFDLDPAPDVSWNDVKAAALGLRRGLKRLKLEAFLKTTGGKGLHVVVPFAGGPTWPQAKAFARAFCEIFATAAPDRFTINNRKDARVGRIYLDYLRNDETASAVAAYSVRARPGAPVSVPIDWSELTRLKSGDAFKIQDVLERRKDPWRLMDHTAERQRLPGT